MIVINVRNRYEYCGDGCCSYPDGCYIDIEVDDVLVHEEECAYQIHTDEDVVNHFSGREDEFDFDINSVTIEII